MVFGFGRDPTELCLIFNHALDFTFEAHNYRLNSWNQPFLVEVLRSKTVLVLSMELFVRVQDPTTSMRQFEKMISFHYIMKGVVSKETVVLCRWGSSVQKFCFINGVDNVNWPPYRDSKS